MNGKGQGASPPCVESVVCGCVIPEIICQLPILGSAKHHHTSFSCSCHTAIRTTHSRGTVPSAVALRWGHGHANCHPHRSTGTHRHTPRAERDVTLRARARCPHGVCHGHRPSSGIVVFCRLPFSFSVLFPCCCWSCVIVIVGRMRVHPARDTWRYCNTRVTCSPWVAAPRASPRGGPPDHGCKNRLDQSSGVVLRSQRSS